MPLADVSGTLSEIFSGSGYVAPFIVLLLCGVGLPLPEEVTLIGAGILTYKGEVEFLPIVLVCSSAILIGDSIPYFLGRRYGMSALKIRWVARVLHPERFQRLRKRFEEHGNWATFACRFFAGIRIPGYFVAGTMGMTYPRFLALDALGVLISVPISIYLGKIFGNSIETLEGKMGDLHLLLAFVVLSMVLIFLVRRRWFRGARRAAGQPTDPEEPPTGAP